MPSELMGQMLRWLTITCLWSATTRRWSLAIWTMISLGRVMSLSIVGTRSSRQATAASKTPRWSRKVWTSRARPRRSTVIIHRLAGCSPTRLKVKMTKSNSFWRSNLSEMITHRIIKKRLHRLDWEELEAPPVRHRHQICETQRWTIPSQHSHQTSWKAPKDHK